MASHLAASSASRAGTSARGRLAAPLVLMAAIALASHTAQPIGLPGGSDKLVHALVFGLLATLWFWARRTAVGPGRAALEAVLISVFWGALDEFHQSFVPGRTADGFDLLADTAGAALAALACWIAARVRGG
ncbi:MAG: VanZ family protein [Acidobacteria bacterium]|nr:VanZ family protein [Acidobacteriota bacterium]